MLLEDGGNWLLREIDDSWPVKWDRGTLCQMYQEQGKISTDAPRNIPSASQRLF
jgi:hypothetical protein